MKFIVSHKGDPTIGVPPESAVVDVDVESYSEEVRHDYCVQVSEALRVAFASVWDAPVDVSVRPSHAPRIEDGRSGLRAGLSALFGASP